MSTPAADAFVFLGATGDLAYKQIFPALQALIVETFAAVRLHIDSERWQGVPFYIRVGKCLPVTATEVLVRFKRPSHPVLDDPEPTPGNQVRFRLSPEVVVALRANVKKAGEAMIGESIELLAHHQPPDEMQPYERLLGDAAHGDATLFAREDAVEESWRIVDPILERELAPIEYDANTWGPTVDNLVPEGGWNDPNEHAPAR